jgi:hypothetical protein
MGIGTLIACLRYKVAATNTSMPKEPAGGRDMIKETTRKRITKTAKVHKQESVSAVDGLPTIESFLPAGSAQRAVAGIAAAAGGALVAAAVLGVGPAALAGAAGYLVYRETNRA